MSKRLLILLALVSLLGTGNGRGGEQGQQNLFKQQGFSLLDPQRLSLSHSLGFYFSSEKGVQSVALYRSSIRYRLSKPLTISMDLDYLHRRIKDSYQKRFLLTNLQVDFHPSPWLNLQINVTSSPWVNPLFKGGR